MLGIFVDVENELADIGNEVDMLSSGVAVERANQTKLAFELLKTELIAFVATMSPTDRA